MLPPAVLAVLVVVAAVGAYDRLSVILVFNDRLVTDASVSLGAGGGLTRRLGVAARLTCMRSVARRRPSSAGVT